MSVACFPLPFRRCGACGAGAASWLSSRTRPPWLSGLAEEHIPAGYALGERTLYLGEQGWGRRSSLSRRGVHPYATLYSATYSPSGCWRVQRATPGDALNCDDWIGRRQTPARACQVAPNLRRQPARNGSMAGGDRGGGIPAVLPAGFEPLGRRAPSGANCRTCSSCLAASRRAGIRQALFDACMPFTTFHPLLSDACAISPGALACFSVCVLLYAAREG